VLSIATMTGHIPSAVSQKFDAMQQGAVPGGATEAPAGRTTQAPAQNSDAGAPPIERQVPIAVKGTTITPPQSATCGNCGVIQSIIAEEVKGKGSVLGTVAGGAVDGTLGQSTGGGQGRDVAPLSGAPGGGYAGNAIERTVKKSMHYVIRVRMEDGTTRVLTATAAPAFSAGQRVRIEDGLLAAVSR
jgi:outer membrane lipoprotein SlyB